MVISKTPQARINSIQPASFTESQSSLFNYAYRIVSKCDRCLLNGLHQSPNQEQMLSHCQQVFQQMGWVILTLNGQVQYMTSQAEQLLKPYLSSAPDDSLDDRLQQWFNHQISQLSFNHNTISHCLPIHIKKPGQLLIIHLIFDPVQERYLLLLEPQKPLPFSVEALESLGLTKREAEVLFWIAKDKSNAGIARVLGCCEGTVRKHLENLYKKLGVQTRIGAVMIALERLGLLRA